MKGKMRMRAISMILAMAILAFGLSLFQGCGRSEEPHAEEEHAGEEDHSAEIELSGDEARELGIEIAVAGPGRIDRTISLPGEIKLNEDRTVHILPRIGGIVREVRVSLGDEVRAGDLLAVIESRELADATAEYLAARERLALAREMHDREEELWKKKISSEQEYLDARQAFAEARIAHRAAEQKLLALGVTEEALREMPTQAESDLTRYEIRSPMSGRLIRKEISLGGSLEADTKIFVVADLGTVWIDVRVYQKDLAYIHEGQKVIISSNGADSPSAEGTVDYLGPILEHETRTALARIILPNPDGTLRPGTFVKAHIPVESDVVPVAVPRDAVQTIEGGTYLFVPTDHGFEAHPVATGRSSHDIAEIVGGFEQGWEYVSKGAFELKAILVTGALDSHAGHGH
jgi:cobalt-zinc-cadmium efflux system membrane fusion protein